MLEGLTKLFQVLGMTDVFWMERTVHVVITTVVVILAILVAYVLTRLLFGETNNQKAQRTRRTYHNR
jgi:hypothetical protein